MVRMIHPKDTGGRGGQASRANKDTNQAARSLGLPTKPSGPALIPVKYPHSPRTTMATQSAKKTRSPLWSQDRIAKAGSHYGAAKARPGQRKAGGFHLSNNSGSYNTLTVFGSFSAVEEMRVVKGVSPDLLERWWYIERNELPPNDYPHLIPTTDDDLREEYKDADAANYMAMTNEIDQLRDDNRQQAGFLIQRIDEIEGEIRSANDPDEILELEQERRKLQGIKRQVDDDHRVEESRITLRYKDHREDAWQDLLRRQRTEIQRANDKLDDLKSNLQNEIQDAVDRWFGASGIFEVDRWTLE